MSPALAAIVKSGQYREYQDQTPELYSLDAAAKARTRILELGAIAKIMNLATVGPDNWPLTSALPFVTVADQAERPVYYVFAPADGQDVGNVKRDPRASLTMDDSLEPGRDRDARAIQIRALAEIVDDAQQWAEAVSALRAKSGSLADTFTRATHALIRVDALRVMVYDVKIRPAFGSVDYFQQ